MSRGVSKSDLPGRPQPGDPGSGINFRPGPVKLCISRDHALHHDRQHARHQSGLGGCLHRIGQVLGNGCDLVRELIGLARTHPVRWVAEKCGGDTGALTASKPPRWSPPMAARDVTFLSEWSFRNHLVRRPPPSTRFLQASERSYAGGQHRGVAMTWRNGRPRVWHDVRAAWELQRRAKWEALIEGRTGCSLSGCDRPDTGKTASMGSSLPSDYRCRDRASDPPAKKYSALFAKWVAKYPGLSRDDGVLSCRFAQPFLGNCRVHQREIRKCSKP